MKEEGKERSMEEEKDKKLFTVYRSR